MQQQSKLFTKIGDIDIDVGDRNLLLDHIEYIPASIRTDTVKRHASGIYVTDIPYDPINQCASIDYKDADDLGYQKLDILNVHLYKSIESETHLLELMKEPDWNNLYDENFVKELIHINNHYHTILKCEAITNIDHLAMLLALIRPSKKHMIGMKWNEIEKSIWTVSGGFAFKMSHAYSYAQLVIVNMNLKASLLG